MLQAGLGPPPFFALRTSHLPGKSRESICSCVSTFRQTLLDVPGTALSTLQIITHLISLWRLGRRWYSITFLLIRKLRQEQGSSHASQVDGWHRGGAHLFLTVVWVSEQTPFQKQDFYDSRLQRLTYSPCQHFLHYSDSQIDWWIVSITEMQALWGKKFYFSCSMLCAQYLIKSLTPRRCSISIWVNEQMRAVIHHRIYFVT